MRPQNLGIARVVSQSKMISAFFAKGFLCEGPLGKRESYLSYSQKLSNHTLLHDISLAELRSTARVRIPKEFPSCE
jgi:hypothetical protein